MKRVKCKSGLEGWQCRLRENYVDFEEFESNANLRGLHVRLGYVTPQEAWDDNPIVQGSVNPSDYRKVTPRKKAVTVIVRKVQRASRNYLMTIANTETGRAVLKALGAQYKKEGKTFRVYGRGSGKKACLAAIADNLNCWEAGAMANGDKPWNRRFYRPRVKYAERLDVYFR